MQIHDAEVRLVLVLHPRPVEDGAKVIPNVQVTRGHNARKHPRAHARLSELDWPFL
jgi:hypothetical protein